jgi:hypothetical protein
MNKEPFLAADVAKDVMDRDMAIGKAFYAALIQRSNAASELKLLIGKIRKNSRRHYRLRVRLKNCTVRCSSCPHPILQAVDGQNRAYPLNGTSTQFRELGYHRNLQEITRQAGIMYRADFEVKRLAKLLIKIEATSTYIYWEMEDFAADSSLIVDPPIFYPPSQLAPCFFLGCCTIAFLVHRCNQMISALQNQVYWYSSGEIHTRYHKAKPGVLGIYIMHKNRNPLIPALFVWRIYLQGVDRKWFSSNVAVFKNRLAPGLPPIKVSIENTPFVLCRTGNRRHINFYRKANKRVLKLKEFRNNIIKLSKLFSAETAVIIKHQSELGSSSD